MAATARPVARDDDPDQRVYLHGLTWKEYELLLAVRGESAVPRMTYLEGELELMSPSRRHEWIKKALGSIVEAYALEHGLTFDGYGSWTLKNSRNERGAEPDECYMVGTLDKDRPDLAIEVLWTSGGIDKLEVYRGLGVGEVWFWREGAIEVYVLAGEPYARADRSAVLPALDLALVARCIDQATSQSDAVRAFLAALRGA